MKYKNISSAIHNFGHSFVSDMNYVDDDFIINDLSKIHRKDQDIKIDWLTGEFEPTLMITERISKSISHYNQSLGEHLKSQGVELAKLTSLYFFWPAGAAKYMYAKDGKGKDYKTEIRETR